MKKSPCLFVSVIGLAVASAAPLFAQDSPAPATSSINAPLATPAATTASSNAAPAGARRGGRRGGPDLGPLPEIHAPVPNTLPGLLGKPIKWVSTGVLVAPQNDATHFLYSVKDPTIFRYNDKWEIYATAYMVSGPAGRPCRIQTPTSLLPAGVVAAAAAGGT